MNQCSGRKSVNDILKSQVTVEDKTISRETEITQRWKINSSNAFERENVEGVEGIEGVFFELF